MNLLYKIKDYARDKYISLLKKNEENKPPNIFYDKALGGYVCNTLLCKEGNGNGYPYVEWIADDLCGDCFTFEYMIDNGWQHEHEISSVIKDAYRYGELFSIPSECEDQYSAQELRVLRRVAKVGKTHRQEYREYLKANNRYNSEFEEIERTYGWEN